MRERPELLAKGERRRMALLGALEELLRKRRLEDLTIAEIAAAAGVQRSGFYFYFPTKHAAVAELLLEFADELFLAGEEFLHTSGDPAAALSDAFEGLLDGWTRHRHLLNALFDARDGDGDVRALFDEWLNRFVGPVAALIARERESGNALAGPEPTLLARLLLTVNQNALAEHLRTPKVSDAELRDALVHVWMTTIYGAPR